MLWYLMACAVIAALLLDQCERERLMQVSIDALDKENAKLRELVRAMWLYDYAGKFSSAPDDVEHVAMVYQRMRELGVEI